MRDIIMHYYYSHKASTIYKRTKEHKLFLFKVNIMKYLLDIILMIIILPISVVVIPIISILILILDSQPIFYTQYRVGLNGKEFKFSKNQKILKSKK